jgi:tagatose-6-phosphate ketose/aldose isomerase
MDTTNQINYFDNISQFRNYTSREISSQPECWWQTWEYVKREQNTIRRFINKLFDVKDLVVILTGAGSSAFIGIALQGAFQKNTNVLTRAISTTDLVTHPDMFLQKEKPTLLVSFARSGDSPESIAAVNLTNEICREAYHLIITCNENGKLAREMNKENSLVFILPPDTNDRGLAMTASFTSMLLSGILISRINNFQNIEKQVSRLISYGTIILSRYTRKLQEISSQDFRRVVFLGSGPLLGAARESHLKLQELTDGRIICKHDSFLGFRHGPKAVIDKSTLVVYLFSNKKYAEQYEMDLVAEICEQAQGMYAVGISEQPKERDLCLDLDIILDDGSGTIDEEFLAVCHVLPAQILGYYKSLSLGFNPDNPSESGVISRVVQGVKIYSY